jgi:hypothetical protein
MRARQIANLAVVSAAALVWLALTPTAHAAFVVSYYNFNSYNGTDLTISPNQGAGSITINPLGSGFTGNFSGTTINALGGDPAGTSLSLIAGTNQVNNGASITIQFSTLGLSDVVLSFATQRTSTGFNSNQLAYSLDGVNFTNFGSPITPASSFALVTFDLSSITALNNQATVYLRYTLNGATSSAGNNRIDNLQITAAPAPANLALAAIGGLCFGAGRLRRR